MSSELSIAELASLYEKICYVGFDPLKIVKEFLERFTTEESFAAAIQHICLMWIVGGPDPDKINKNAAKNKVRDGIAAGTAVSKARGIQSGKLTGVVKSFVLCLLIVRRQLVSSGSIKEDQLFYDTAFIGWHEDGIRASVDLGRAIAMSKNSGFDETQSRMRATVYGQLAIKSAGPELTQIWGAASKNSATMKLGECRSLYSAWLQENSSKLGGERSMSPARAEGGGFMGFGGKKENKKDKKQPEDK